MERTWVCTGRTCNYRTKTFREGVIEMHHTHPNTKKSYPMKEVPK